MALWGTLTGLDVVEGAVNGVTPSKIITTTGSTVSPPYDTYICNLALARIGISQFLDDATTDQTLHGIVCRKFYEEAWKRVMGAGVWAFATRQVELVQSGTANNHWSYRYAYPTDCIQAVEITGNILPSWSGYWSSWVLMPLEWSPIGVPFDVVQNESGNGLSIMCSITPAYLKYVANVTDPALFPTQFKSAFAWALASEIASPLSASPDMAKRANQAYQSILNDAMANSMNEAEPRKYLNSFVAARLI